MTQADLSIKMDIIDTLHDFCKSERGDGDAAGDKRIDFMRTYITNLLKKKAYSNQSTLNEILSDITNTNVTAISKLEHESLDFFEKTYPSLLNVKGSTKKEVLTYDTILDSWSENTSEKENPLWKRLREDQDITILEIVKGKSKDYNPDKLSVQQLGILGNFLLNFFFGVEMVPAGGIGKFPDIRVTFDAKTGLPGKIFTTLDQVKNIMFPQTIADSATTSLNILNGRSEYIFPGVDGQTIPIESARFSTGEYVLSYTNKGFTNKNPFGFSLEISKGASSTSSISAPFGSTQTEGPSVNYIIDILKLAKNSAGTPKFTDLEKSKKANILSLGKAIDGNSGFKTSFVSQVRKEEDGLLPDIKRSGDHEAAIVTRKTRLKTYTHLIFITIDILCALKSRNLENPTIWHNNNHLILYRFPPNPTLMATIRYETFLRKLANAIETIDILNTIKTSLQTSLTQLQTRFEEGKSAFFAVVKKGEAGESTAETIVTILGRFRMIALQEQATKAFTLISTFSKDFRTLKGTFQKVQALPETTLKPEVMKEKVVIDSDDITALLAEVDTAAKSLYTLVEEALDLSIQENILVGKKGQKTLQKQLSIQKDVFTIRKTTNNQDKRIFTSEDYPMFYYYPQTFLDLYESLLTLSTLTKPTAATASALRKYNAAFDKTLDTYQHQVDSLLQQFSAESISGVETLFNILDITKLKPKAGIADKAEARREAAIEYFQGDGLVKALEAHAESKGLAKPYALTYPLQAGGQRGGAGNLVLQHYDLSLLLFKVSTMAATFFESAYAKEYPYWSLFHLYNELVEDITKRKIKDIKFLHSKLISLYNALVPFRLTKSSIPESVKFDQVPNPSTKTYAAAADMTPDLDKIKAFFDVLGENTQPTLDAFLTKLTEPEYTENFIAEFLLTEMLADWTQGYIELAYNDGYDFVVTGDDTSILISYLLSFDQTGESYYVYTDSLGRRSAKDAAKIKADFLNIEEKKRMLILLFAFACLENRMNPTKESCFIKKTATTKQFASAEEWNNSLYSYFSTILTTLKTNMTNQFQLTIEHLSGGGKRKYAKKTRKNKNKHTKRSKRMTKRRKH